MQRMFGGRNLVLAMVQHTYTVLTALAMKHIWITVPIHSLMMHVNMLTVLELFVLQLQPLIVNMEI